MDRQSNIQIDKVTWTDEQINRKTHEQILVEIDKQIDRHADRQTYVEPKIWTDTQV
jgi:hypothetical protein